MKTGDVVSYHEDGGICLCELLDYKEGNGEESAIVRVLEVIAQPRMGGDYIVGEEHKVWHVTNFGFGGDWAVFPEGTYYKRTAPTQADAGKEKGI